MKLELQPILALPDDRQAEKAFIRFDDLYAYIATTSAIWRIDKTFDSSSAKLLLKAGTGDIQNLYVESDGLYLLKNRGKDGHTFLRSRDQGSTFDALDGGLLVDESGVKAALAPTIMIRDASSIIINAGGGINVLVSVDDTLSWKLLRGSFATQICYPGKLLRLGRDLVLGGECPLDSAYLMKGKLSQDMTRWVSPPKSVAPNDISNRNVQFINMIDGWSMLFAGVEGGLLSSDNNGSNWKWSLKMEANEAKYPYIQHCIRYPAVKDAALIGGYDKANDAEPFLAVTADRGISWIDCSNSLQSIGRPVREVQDIAISPNGAVLVATFDTKQSEIVICEANLK
jgi:hypothetical protein